MNLEDAARKAEGKASEAYRETESYTKRNWLWLYPAVAGAAGLIGYVIGRLH